MPISFHCESCKKKIKAPDEGGGKWGSCPNCSHRCYIPLPPATEDEMLTLAPLDPSEETQYEQMKQEAHSLRESILHETTLEDEAATATGVSDFSEKELIKDIIVYLRQMADGQLEDAQKMIGRIARFAPNAMQLLKKMAKAERPEPELTDIAPAVLHGLIKGLAAKIK